MSQPKDMDFELVSVSHNAKVMDAIQFYQSAKDYIEQADLMRQAFDAVVQSERDTYKQWFTELTNHQHLELYSTTTPLFGLSIATDTAFTFIARSFVQSLHSFVDSYGQFVNRCVFGSNAAPVQEVQPKKVAAWLRQESKSDTSVKPILDELTQFASSRDYLYITALSDVLKHHHVVDVMSTVRLNDGKVEVKVRGFTYAGTHYEVRDLEDILANTLGTFGKFFADGSAKVYDFLRNRSVHPYTSNRRHDLEFGTQFYGGDEGPKRALLQYLTVDVELCPDAFGILSVQIDPNGIPVTTNSVADVIVLRDTNQRIHGMIRAVQELPGKDDVPLVMYRRYEKVAPHEFHQQFWAALHNDNRQILLTTGEIILSESEMKAFRTLPENGR